MRQTETQIDRPITTAVREEQVGSLTAARMAEIGNPYSEEHTWISTGVADAELLPSERPWTTTVCGTCFTQRSQNGACEC